MLDKVHSAAIDLEGNVVVAGTSDGLRASADWIIVKYGADGSQLWEGRYDGGQSFDSVVALSTDTNGDVFVSGSINRSQLDFLTMKFSGVDGSIIWEKHYDGPFHFSDIARDMKLDGDGNVIVTGSSSLYGNHTDYLTLKYAAADGAILWEKRYNGPANRDDQPAVLTLDSVGNAVVIGTATNEIFRSRWHMVKYSRTDGAVLWQRTFDSAHSLGGPLAFAIDVSDDLLAAGDTANRDIYVSEVQRR